MMSLKLIFENCFDCKINVVIAFSWSCSVWSSGLVGTFCCHRVPQRPQTVCVLCQTMEHLSNIIHLSAAAARSVQTY